MTRIVSIWLLAAVLGLSACGVTDRMGKRVDDSWAADMLFSSEDQVVLTVDGGNELNPDESGQPLSVVVRIYQLTALERFLAVDPDGLWDAPEASLGTTLLDVRELTVRPGLGQIERWPMLPTSQYIAVAAFFRNSTEGLWKVAFTANSFRKDGIWFSSNGARVLIDKNSISAERGSDVLNQQTFPKGAFESGHTEAGKITNPSDSITDVINE